MNKKIITVKLIILAVAIVLFISGKASAAENDGLRFEGIRDTTIEAKSKFSTVNGIKGYRDGKEVGYSVYYKGKKISSSNYINTSKPTKRGQYHLLRYELKAHGKVKNVHRKIFIKDRTAPKFTGINNISINFGSKFSTIKNVKAVDSVDGKRGYSVYISKNKKWYKVSKNKYVNTRKAGKYYLKYVVKDKSGNTTTKLRTVTVRPKPVKTTKKLVKKKSTPKTYKVSNTVHIYPRANNEAGWWYQGGNQSKLYIHSARGENLRNIKVGTKLVVHLNGTTYEYYTYDKSLVWGPKYNYQGSSKAKEWRYVTRNNRLALDAINSAPLYLQTCYNADSQILIALAKPINPNKQLQKANSIFVSSPQ